MRLLATIPDLGEKAAAMDQPLCSGEPVASHPLQAAQADPADSADSAAAVGPIPRPLRSVRVTTRKPFPWASVAALLAVAAAVWSLASWNDARRLARQQFETRLADRPVATSAEGLLR